MQDRTGKDGRIGSNPLASLIKWTGFYQEPWVRALDGGEFKASNGQEMVAIFGFLEFCLTQVVMDNELGALQVRVRAPPRSSRIVSSGIAHSPWTAHLVRAQRVCCAWCWSHINALAAAGA